MAKKKITKKEEILGKQLSKVKTITTDKEGYDIFLSEDKTELIITTEKSIKLPWYGYVIGMIAAGLIGHLLSQI